MSFFIDLDPTTPGYNRILAQALTPQGMAAMVSASQPIGKVDPVVLSQCDAYESKRTSIGLGRRAVTVWDLYEERKTNARPFEPVWVPESPDPYDGGPDKPDDTDNDDGGDGRTDGSDTYYYSTYNTYNTTTPPLEPAPNAELPPINITLPAGYGSTQSTDGGGMNFMMMFMMIMMMMGNGFGGGD